MRLENGDRSRGGVYSGNGGRPGSGLVEGADVWAMDSRGAHGPAGRVDSWWAGWAAGVLVCACCTCACSTCGGC